MTEAEFRLTIDYPKLNAVAEESARGAVERAGERTVEQARTNLEPHNRTGDLSRSLASRLVHSDENGAQVTVGSDLDYATYAEEGRGPITAKPGKRLVFMPRGSRTLVFATKVKAAKGIRYLRRAYEALQESDFGR